MFRDDLEQDSGMKVNTGSGLKANSLRADPGTAFGFAGMISTRQIAALDNTMANSLPLEREDELASQEIVRAQDQRSSSIEV